MSLDISLVVCPNCMSWQSTPFCGDCGSGTVKATTCSNCRSTADAKFCGNCGKPTYGKLLEGGQGQRNHPSQGRSPSNPRVHGPETTSRWVDTTSIIQEIRPTLVRKGISGVDDDPLAKYRVASVEEALSDNLDWHQALKDASRANVHDDRAIEILHEPPVFKNTPASHSAYSQSVRPSEVVRGKEADDGLAQYRTGNTNNQSGVSSSPATGRPPTRLAPSNNQYPESQTIKPSVLRDTGDDVLQKYRIKSPEEEEKTWEISLENLPSAPGKRVELVVDGKQLYSGEGNRVVVCTRASLLCNSGSSDFSLKINAINFNLNRKLEIGAGKYVRFAVEQGQMKFRQQKTDFLY